MTAAGDGQNYWAGSAQLTAKLGSESRWFFNRGVWLKVMTSEVQKQFSEALAALNDRDLRTAENKFRSVLDLEKGNIPALNLLTAVLMSLGRFNEAEPFIAKAVVLNNTSDVSFYNYGLIAKQLKKPKLAYEQFTRALQLNSSVAETWNNRGTVCNDLETYELAIADFNKAIELNQKYAAAHANKGKSLAHLKRYDEAFTAYEKALSIKPNLENAWLGKGNVFSDLKRYDEALTTYDQALSIKPNLENAWLGRGNVFCDLKRYDEAFAAYDKALSIKPDLDNAWLGKGNVFCDLKRYDEALTAYDKALSIKPDLENAWLGRGNVFFYKNNDADALTCFDKAIELKPDLAEGHWNKALLKLSLGEFEEGWKLYEWRWETRDFTSPKRDFTQPRWLNNFDINGKTLLVYWEQGLGDTIQFCRYLSLLRDTGAKVVFEVQKPLLSLIKAQNWDCDVIAYGDAIPPFDAHCPLLSLPLLFNTRVENLPHKTPYISIPNNIEFDLKDSLEKSEKPKIGIAWSGNPHFAKGNDVRRPIALSCLSSIMTSDFDWFRLQKDIRDSDKEALREMSFIVDCSERFASFYETAMLIKNMDLIISIDTSVAHLAGGMGKPVWVLLPFHPDFRWLRDRIDSPWYPTARLYRQTKDGEWADVLDCLSIDLKNFHNKQF